MTEAHVFIATSLDGFIARPDGGIDWLEMPELAGEDHGYDAFVARMDGLIMGRATYETVLGFGDWPYNKPIWVLSRNLRSLPAELEGRVRLLDASPREALAEAQAAGWARAYVDGGRLIQSFLAEGLISEMILSRLPVLLGAGRPLFGGLPCDVALTHLGTQSFPSGLVQSHYRVGI